MKTLALVCEKGGVAKTTLATTIAAGLAAAGSRVLLVDGDSQGHTTLAMRHERADGLANLLLGNAPFRDVVLRVDPSIHAEGSGLLLLLPGSKGNAKLAETLTNALALRQRLQQLDGLVNYVVIDTAPAISKLLTAVYFAADYVLFPTQCEYYSIEALIRSLEHLESAQKIGAEKGHAVGQFLGIVPTMFNGRESVQYQNLGWLQGSYGRSAVLSPIRQRTAWKQANQMRQPVFLYERKSEAAREAERFIEEVISRLGEPLVAAGDEMRGRLS